MEVDPDILLRSQFEEWKKKTGNRTLELKQMDTKLFSMQLVMSGGIFLFMYYVVNIQILL